MDRIITYSFCDSFKAEFAEYIKTNYIEKGKPLDRLAIIFAGKRPSLYIKKELSNIFKKSFIPPKFFSIDEFIKYLLNKKEDFSTSFDMNNCYILYNLIRKNTAEILGNRKSFAGFLPWIREILSFIDHLDIEDIGDEVLKNIQANADIGYDIPKDINNLLKQIIVLRNMYHKNMNLSKIYSRGMQYLKASRFVNDINIDEFDDIIFCNFFYFNKTEEKIAKYLYDLGKAVFIFQGDQRKWPVLDRISKHFSCEIKEGIEPRNPNFNLELHSTFDVNSQACAVREILKSIDNLSKTVVVLPDDNNLIPLISEISCVTENFNVSMGYPVKRSSIYSLIALVSRTQLSKNGSKYYTKDYLKLMRHPFVKNLKVNSEASVTRILVHKIEEVLTGRIKSSISGSIFITLEDIENLDETYNAAFNMLKGININVEVEDLKKILKFLHNLLFVPFEKVDNFKSFIGDINRLLNTIIKYSPIGNYQFNYNIANRILEVIDKFSRSDFINEKFSIKDIFDIFDNKLSNSVISFKGSPLKGLQILGLLETRSLDFKNVIIMDVNEGVLPKLKTYEPLIPRDIKISLNMESLALEEEMQRYQFMRLISSAKNVFLVYQENREKEKSRFIEELIWDNEKTNKGKCSLNIIKSKFSSDIVSDKKKFYKTKEILGFLRNYTYSASSINTYIKDPVEFYYRYVLGLRDKDDLLDEPDAKSVGVFMHELLEENFRQFLGAKPIIDDDFEKQLLKSFDKKFNSTFTKNMKSDCFLTKTIMEERLKRFIDNERNSANRNIKKIMFIEECFDDVLDFSSGKIKFRYIVDRVDQMADDSMLVIDYKTGNMDKMAARFSKINDMKLSREKILENVISFQMPLYFHYMINKFNGYKINAALYSLRTMELKKFITDKNQYSFEEIDSIFMRALDFVISEILDPNVPFEV